MEQAATELVNIKFHELFKAESMEIIEHRALQDVSFAYMDFYQERFVKTLKFAINSSLYAQEYTLNMLDVEKSLVLLFIYSSMQEDLSGCILVDALAANPQNQLNNYDPRDLKLWLKNNFIFGLRHCINGQMFINTIKEKGFLQLPSFAEDVLINLTSVIHLPRNGKCTMNDTQIRETCLFSVLEQQCSIVITSKLMNAVNTITEFSIYSRLFTLQRTMWPSKTMFLVFLHGLMEEDLLLCVPVLYNFLSYLKEDCLDTADLAAWLRAEYTFNETLQRACDYFMKLKTWDDVLPIMPAELTYLLKGICDLTIGVELTPEIPEEEEEEEAEEEVEPDPGQSEENNAPLDESHFTILGDTVDPEIADLFYAMIMNGGDPDLSEIEQWGFANFLAIRSLLNFKNYLLSQNNSRSRAELNIVMVTLKEALRSARRSPNARSLPSNRTIYETQNPENSPQQVLQTTSGATTLNVTDTSVTIQLDRALLTQEAIVINLRDIIGQRRNGNEQSSRTDEPLPLNLPSSSNTLPTQPVNEVEGPSASPSTVSEHPNVQRTRTRSQVEGSSAMPANGTGSSSSVASLPKRSKRIKNRMENQKRTKEEQKKKKVRSRVWRCHTTANCSRNNAQVDNSSPSTSRGNGRRLTTIESSSEDDFHSTTIMGNGRTLIHYATLSGFDKVLEKISKSKFININAKDDSGNTALHLAVRKNNYRSVKILVEVGHADVNSVTNNGRSALHLACELRNLRIVKYLVQMKAKLNLKDSEGFTPLKLSYKDGRPTAVTLFLSSIGKSTYENSLRNKTKSNVHLDHNFK